MVAAPFLVWLIVEARFGTALLVVGFAGISDWLDGYTARRLGATGNLGTILDPLADKAMLVSLFLALTYVALIPIWVLALVLGRDAVIVTGAVLLRIFRGIQKFVPSTVRQSQHVFPNRVCSSGLAVRSIPMDSSALAKDHRAGSRCAVYRMERDELYTAGNSIDT